jgi:hypothetical protein
MKTASMAYSSSAISYSINSNYIAENALRIVIHLLLLLGVSPVRTGRCGYGRHAGMLRSDIGFSSTLMAFILFRARLAS